MGRQSSRSRHLRFLLFLTLACFLFLFPAAARAQKNQFGGQDRADAAARMIVLGVQQAIGSLPPTSGQSFTYEFDPELAMFVAGKRLGPTAFRAAETLGAGKFSFRLAGSYFELAETFDPIPYFNDGGLFRPQAREIRGRVRLADRGDDRRNSIAGKILQAVFIQQSNCRLGARGDNQAL